VDVLAQLKRNFAYESGYKEGYMLIKPWPGSLNNKAYMLGWKDGRGDRIRKNQDEARRS
jgi:hypothetical protein